MGEYISYKAIAGMLDQINRGDIVYLISDVLELAKTARANGEQFDANEFLQSIMEKIGNEGTLLVPVFNWDFCKGKAFDYKKTRGKTGALGNAALKHLDFARTKHPIYSFAVWGKEKQTLISIEEKDCFGKGTVFEFLYERKAKALVIGLEVLEGFTMMHYVEQKVQVPYRYFKEFRAPYIDEDGIEKEDTATMYVRDLNINPIEQTSHLSQIIEDLNISRTRIINDIAFRTVFIKPACDVIQMDLEWNEGRNLYRY